MKKLLFPLILATIGIALVGASFIISPEGKGGLELEIEKASFIMPAAHKVYANPEALDGKYYLFKAKITNQSGVKLEDVLVRYRIPGYIEWTELETIGEMFRGQTASVVCYPKFDEKVTEKTTESLEKVEIEVTWDGAQEDDTVEEEFAFKLTNRNEYVYTGISGDEISSWADMFDNDDLLACFVTPNDPVLKYYTQIVQEKVLKGEAASVTNKPEDGVRFLMGIYEATRMSHMVYSGTKGIPQSLEDVSSTVQHVRLPREVVTGNTGLCIELSVLYASMLSSAGLDPIIYLIPGHAYPGFRMNGQYFAIEATAIGGEGLGGIGTAEEAFKKGQEQLQEFIKYAQSGDPRYTIVDVHQLNQQGVTSMALADNDFLRQKVNDIAKNFSQSKNTGQAEKLVVQRGDEREPRPDNPKPPPSSRGFTVPSGWYTQNRPYPEVPILTMLATSPDQITSVSVYDIPANSGSEAINVLNQYVDAMGMYMEYQINGNALIGQTDSGNGVFNWVGKVLPRRNGFRIVTVGAPEYMYSERQSLVNSIYNSIR